jgi:hypothetical protein
MVHWAQWNCSFQGDKGCCHFQAEDRFVVRHLQIIRFAMQWLDPR